MSVDYRVGDVRDLLAEVPDGSVDLVTCSPPFLALRSYLPEGHEAKHAEIGSEATPAEFLSTLLGLAREWRRIVAPHGSIAIELGDTYAGSGGAGGDYAEGGMRDGQRKFKGSARRDCAPMPQNDRNGGRGWPLPKSLTGIPTLFAWSLAYGRNLLDPSDTLDPWRVRNVIVWARPNPAVGALGDKYRPATSYITVACPSDRRWFDLDAVRSEPSPNTHARPSKGTTSADRSAKSGARGNFASMPELAQTAGAPPLDHWTDDPTDPSDGDLTWKLSTEGPSVKVPIVTSVPCGPHDGGERTTSPDCPVHGDRAAQAPTESDGEPRDDRGQSPRIPRSDSRPEPGPYLADEGDASTGSHSAWTATSHGTESSRTDLAPSTSQPDTPSARTADGTARTSASPALFETGLDTDGSNSDEACPPVGELETEPRNDHTSDPESACTCSFHRTETIIHSHYAMWPSTLAARLVDSMCPREVCRECGTPRRRITERANAAGFGFRKTADDRLGRSVSTALPDVAVVQTLGWSDCGHDNNYRPGITLDPFAGTGTTLAAADFLGRDAIGIDLDPRNRDLYERRRVEVVRKLNPTAAVELPGQLELLDGVA